jgi:hypothetical protein
MMPTCAAVARPDAAPPPNTARRVVRLPGRGRHPFANVFGDQPPPALGVVLLNRKGGRQHVLKGLLVKLQLGPASRHSSRKEGSPSAFIVVQVASRRGKKTAVAGVKSGAAATILGLGF